jgi:hypothetical protein
MHLPQELMLHFHGGLKSIKVGGVGSELAMLTLKRAEDLFFLLLQLLLLLHHLLLPLGNGLLALVEFLLQLGTGVGVKFSLNMELLGLL